MPDAHASDVDTRRTWLGMLPPQSILTNPITRQQGRGIMTMWLLFVLLSTTVIVHIAGTADESNPAITGLLFATINCALLSPLILRQTGN